jgi:adenylate cyclase
VSSDIDTLSSNRDSTVDWLIDGAPGAGTPVAILSGLCDRLVAAGVNIARCALFVETLHPTVIGRRLIWEPGKEVQVDEASFTFAASAAFQSAPIQVVNKTGEPLRRQLHLDDCPNDFPAIDEFRREGLTDYLVLPMRFTNGEIHAVSWSTRRPKGFTEADITALKCINGPLARLTETYALRRVAGNLLDTYVGSRTGLRILSGHIRRGDMEEIDAAIWMSDLRGFTAMADTLSGEELMETLNAQFDCLVPPVGEFGGEVLKFMGDGMLAIFPIGDDRLMEDAVGSAFTAALNARENLSALNVERKSDGKEPLSFGLALNIGRIHYGNIGAENRLDFTAIGPAVNLAARMETVAAEMGRDIVYSAHFGRYLNTAG